MPDIWSGVLKPIARKHGSVICQARSGPTCHHAGAAGGGGGGWDASGDDGDVVTAR